MSSTQKIKPQDIESSFSNYLIFKSPESYYQLSKLLEAAHNELYNYYILNDAKSDYHISLKETIFKSHFLEHDSYIELLFKNRLFSFYNKNPLQLVFDKGFYKSPEVSVGCYSYLFSKTAQDFKPSKHLQNLKNINYPGLHEIVEFLCFVNHKNILPAVSILYTSYEANEEYIKKTEKYFIDVINKFNSYEKFESFMGEFNNHIYSEKKVFTDNKLKNFFFNLDAYIKDHIKTLDTSHIENFYTFNLNEKTQQYFIQYLDFYFSSNSPSDFIANEKKLLIDKLISHHEKTLIENVIDLSSDKKNIIKI